MNTDGHRFCRLDSGLASPSFWSLAGERLPAMEERGFEQSLSVLQSCNFAQGRQRFGVRWQSAAATPLFERGPASESGVALRFPPHSKPCGCGASRAVFICVHLWFSSARIRLIAPLFPLSQLSPTTSLAPMNVFVTGGAGYIGSNCAEALLYL